MIIIIILNYIIACQDKKNKTKKTDFNTKLLKKYWNTVKLITQTKTNSIVKALNCIIKPDRVFYMPKIVHIYGHTHIHRHTYNFIAKYWLI